MNDNSLLGSRRVILTDDMVTSHPEKSSSNNHKPAKIDEAVRNLESINEKIEEKLDEELESRGLPTRDQDKSLAEEEISRLRENGTYDLFDHIERDFFNKQIDVVYVVYRGNSIVGEKQHPYSWMQLQRDFGAGRYKIQAKNAIDRQYISQQSMTVEISLPQTTNQIHNPLPQEPKTNPLDDLVKMASVLKAIMPTPEIRKDDSEFAKILVEMQKSTQETIKEMNKNTNDMMKDLVKEMRDTTKEMTHKIEKISENKQAKEIFSPKDIMDMLNKAKDEGFEKWQMLDEMAEKRAERLADSHEEKPKESMLEKLAVSLGPIIATAMAQQQAVPQNVVPMQRRVNSHPAGPPQNIPPKQVQAGPANNPATSPQVPPKGGRLPPPASKPQPMNKQSPKPTSEGVNEVQMKEKIINILFPVMTQSFMAQKSVKDAAVASIPVLAANGLTLDGALKVLSRDDIIAIARHNNLPNEMVNLLSEYYSALEELRKGTNAISDATRVDAGPGAANG
jgi:hypothetical protein